MTVLNEEDWQFHLVRFRWVLILFAFQEDPDDKGREIRKVSVTGNQIESRNFHRELLHRADKLYR